MKAKELRIGNLIFKPKYENGQRILVPRAVTAIGQLGGKVSQLQDDNYIFNYSDVEPIPLSEEWLFNFGLSKCDQKNNPEEIVDWNDFDYYYAKDDFAIGFSNGKFYAVSFKTFNAIEEQCIWPVSHPIEFVHQIQNLHFTLTGEELIYL